ncbi:PQQ-binding-like beta-propeller repeat protein [Haloarchaeobius sp. DFWS5]|uniref:outer membrane protein assembly factor BamB family protein n=1 Tax=Haloarchaeobius sp. DFWS5 TaxID=3446114 RepID=UPI003EB8514A
MFPRQFPSSLTREWRVSLDGEKLLAPVAVAGGIVVASHDGFVQFLTDDGETQWRYSDFSPFLGLPAVTRDAVVVPSLEGKIVGLEIDSGDTLWEVNRAGIQSGFTLSDGTMYFHDMATQVGALDPSDGSLRWTTEVDGQAVTPPAADSTRLVTASLIGDVTCLDRTNGAVQWVNHTNRQVLSPPSIAKGAVFVCGNRDERGRIAAYELDTGARLWETIVPGQIVGSPAIEEESELLYFASLNGDVAAFDTATGNVQMQNRVGRNLKSPVVFEKVIVVAGDQQLFVLSKQDGSVLDSPRIGGQAIDTAYRNGRLFVSTAAGDVLSFRGRSSNSLSMPGVGLLSGIAGLAGFAGYARKHATERN